MLVEKSVLNLWKLFSSNLDDSGQAICPQTMECISDCLKRHFSIEAFRFYEKFFAEYGINGIGKFFHSDRNRLFSPLIERRYGYGKTDLLITIRRDFLSEEEYRKVLDWLQEFYFVEEPAIPLS